MKLIVVCDFVRHTRYYVSVKILLYKIEVLGTFSGFKKATIWHRFSIPVTFESSAFRKDAAYLKSKTNLFSPNLVQ